MDNNELLFEMEGDVPSVYYITSPKVELERQFLVGGMLTNSMFSFQGLPPKPLCLNLSVTTLDKAETSLTFFEADDAAEYCVRIIHKVSIDFFSTLERKFESGVFKLTSVFVEAGCITSHNAMKRNELEKMVEDGLLIPSSTIDYLPVKPLQTEVKKVGVEISIGDACPTWIEVELLRLDYGFGPKEK